MTDIVERLRALNADFLHDEAADEIERLRAERDAVNKSARKWEEAAEKIAEQRDDALQDGFLAGHQAALAECERLREALRRIGHSADYDTIISPDGDRHQQAVEIALEALTEGGR